MMSAQKVVRAVLHTKADGGGGIRTHDTLIMHTHFPGVLLQPLGHSSKEAGSWSTPASTEREGFEPSIPLRVCILSRDVPSAAQPPFQTLRLLWRAG